MLSLPVADSPHGLGELDFRTYSLSHARISALSIEHDDLDSAIDALVAANTHDDLTVARLKKRKLQIRDEIAGLVAASRTRDAGTLPSDVDSNAARPHAAGATVAAPKPVDGSAALGIFVALSVLLMLGLGWSDLVDFLNQTAAQISLLSLVVAAHG